MPAGFRIGPRPPVCEPALLERFRALPAALVSDAMLRMVAGGANLRPMGPPSLCGRALTVKTAPGDNLMVHKALDLAEAGDVIVVDAGGDLTNAIIGERMVTLAIHRKLAGFVINGAIRDSGEMRISSLPVFAAGVTHRGPYKNGPGEINFAISIGGMVIQPGDIIIGDDDGFVAVPLADAPQVCAEAERRGERERANDPITESREWIDTSLRRLGCENLGFSELVAAQ